MTFQEDYSRCLADYLAVPPGEAMEGLRDHLYRAWLLLDRGGPERQAEACRILENAPYGPCPYSGVPAVQILTGFSGRLTGTARQRLTDFLRDGCAAWAAELARGRYDSYRLLAAVSLAGCGCLQGDPALVRTGCGAVAQMLDHLQGYDLPDEYLSPFYTTLQLSSLAVLRGLPVGSDARQTAARLEDFIWQGVLRHFVPGFPQIAGPYSRAYTTGLCGGFQTDMAALYRLLGSEAGYTLTGTLWDPAYTAGIVPHGSVENMRLYALYFGAFPYACAPATLAAWRGRTLPCRYTERTHTAPSSDAGLKQRDAAGAPPVRYAAGDTTLHTLLDADHAVAWADREYENGMACNSFSVLYRAGGAVRTCFTKLARDDRYIGQWNDYPNLGLRLSECNFPDDGRKAVSRRGDGLLVRYTPRPFCRQAARLRMGILFPCLNGAPGRVLVNGSPAAPDGARREQVRAVTVEDGPFRFHFQPQDQDGYWQILVKNRFLNIEWIKGSRDFDALQWAFLFRMERRAPETETATN